ncbi:MAG: pyridoxamine 5'-phosphate oxidase family protein [Pseudolabrys sp.]|nr:pyridoxamine 5'-phosphate oxidase family protein [Pseudolabrys sp.]
MANSADRVWEILAKHSIGMLTTHFAGGLRARPVDARPDAAEGVIYFLTDRRGLKDDEVAADPRVGFVVVDDSEKAYLSITGTASVTVDAQRAEKIWKSSDDVWWPERERDPNVRVVRLEPQTAELWDGPKSSAVAAFELMKARAFGTEPDLGQNRKKTINLSV